MTMFYTLIDIVVINFYLLLSYVAILKKDKFTKYLIFRETLYKVLFKYVIGAEVVGVKDILPVARPITAVAMLPPGGLIPRADAGAERVDAKIVVRIVYKVGKILKVATVAVRVKYQRGLLLKRSICVICKEDAVEKRRGIRG